MNLKCCVATRSMPSIVGRRTFSNQSMTYFQKMTLPANTILKFVPQQQAWVVERMGKFHRLLNPGPNILMPFIDKVKYVQSLKEVAVQIDAQSAITSDNVTLHLDSVLFVKVEDPFKASYGVEDANYAITQLAQTGMRSEIGRLTLQEVLKERQALNESITQSINEAAKAWGMACLRHEIKDIQPPKEVLDAMHRQVSSERTRRAEILESEGHRQAAINRAEGEKQTQVLQAEGVSEAIALLSTAIKTNEQGKDAVQLQIAQKYIEAFEKIAKETNTVVIPAQLNDIGGMISGGMSILNTLKKPQNI